MSLTFSTGFVRVSAALVLLILLGGCSDSGFESQFAYSDRTTALISEAQNGTKDDPGVKARVDDRFGNPQHLKAWQKLPVDFGGVAAVVSAAPGSEPSQDEIRLAFGEDTSSAVPDSVSSIQFVSGACTGEIVAVKRWDSVKSVATLAGSLRTAPAEGDAVVTDAGRNLKAGRVLYQKHCVHCHGTSGDGNGPTAVYLYPRPRDYRHGIFKFTSTNDLSRASRDDLLRILRQGIPGTYMPSFLLLSDTDLHAIIEYVRFLAMRGEFERKLAAELATDYASKSVQSRVKNGETRTEIVKELTEFLKTDLPGVVSTAGDELAEAWGEADTSEVKVTPTVARVADTRESRRRGRELYLSKDLKCADCHGVSGQGNGPQTEIYEKNPITNEMFREPGLHDVWDNVNQPRNLTHGIYRGGRRPIDLFARINAGIKGSRMPAFKNVPHEDVWHLVNYVLSIPFEVEPGASGATPAVAAAEAASAP